MTLPTHSPIYQKAFARYLRKGTPIALSIKMLLKAEQERTTALYRWHTAGDNKVRPEHAANDGKIFSWAYPPDTGHPGEAINCRCWAEPVEVETTPLEVLALFSGAGIVRRVGVRVVGGLIRRINRPTTPPAKPAEPPPLPKPEGIPKNWEKSPSNNSQGVRYRDPQNKHNEVRVQRGNPNSPNAAQRRDYVKWKKEGHYLDKYGKKVPGDSPKAHIPIEEFEFNPELFK